MKRIFSVFLAAALAAGLLAAPAAAAGRAFSDVPAGAWYEEAVDYAVGRGLFSGIGGGKFSPGGDMTRGMFVAVLARAAGADTSAAADAGFVDVGETWYAGAVNWAAEKGYVGGVGGNCFAPERPITREQIAVILRNYLVSTGAAIGADAGGAPFGDADQISAWAAEGVEYMRVTGLMAGDARGNFSPRDTLPRAEAATVFMRLDQRLGGEMPQDPAAPGDDDDDKQGPGKAAFEVTTPSFNISSSVYDDNIGDTEVGVIKITDYENGFTDMRYMDAYFSDVVKYTFTSSDPDVIKVNENGGLYDPIRLEADDDPVTATITVTRQSGESVDVSVTVSPRGGWYVVDDEYIAEFAEEATKLVNEYRAEAGVNAIVYASFAQDYANARSAELIDDFSHTWKNPNLADEFGVDVPLTAENISRTSITYNNGAVNVSPAALAQRVVNGLYDSINHRNTMLRPTYEYMVIGVSVDGDSNNIFCSQLFDAEQ